MTEQIRRLILPFAVAAKDRFKPVTKDMEMAAIFYLAESDRKKKEGRILKKTGENLCFIAETCYPLWMIPWKGRTFLFDGLNLTKHLLYYDVVPDIEAFNSDIQASSKSREAYCASLSQNASYFQNFAGKEEKTIEGLIMDPEFTEDFMEYLQEVEVGKLITTKAFLSPVLDESGVSASIEKLADLRETVKRDIKDLSTSMKLLSKKAKEQVKSFRSEMKDTLKNFDLKIEEVRPQVTEKIKKIQDKRDNEITRISKKYDSKLRSLHKDRVKIERTIERLTTDMERYEADIKGCRERKDETGELQLAQKLDETKKRIPILQKEIKEVDKEIEKVEEEKKIEISRARTKPDDSIEEARKVLRDIEAAKEARIRVEQQQLADLEEMTSAIINHIDEMVKTKERTLNELESMGIPDRRRKDALVYVPFYFVCYETKSSKRYAVIPPSILGSMGITTKLKGFFGASKMKSFLQPRSQAIATLLDQLVDLTQQNPVFESEITEAGIEASILRTAESRTSIKRGLTELLEENWISKNDFQMLNEQL